MVLRLEGTWLHPEGSLKQAAEPVPVSDALVGGCGKLASVNTLPGGVDAAGKGAAL